VLQVAETVFTTPIYSRGGMTLFLPLTAVLAFSTLSLLRAKCSHTFVIEGSFVCLWFYRWLVSGVLRGLLAVLLPAALVSKVMALRKGLYLRDRAMRVRIAMVVILGSRVLALGAFTLDPQL
jgi:hypothetical protein